jgi:hypothetical protein
MNKSKMTLQKGINAFLPAFIFISNELIRTYIRPIYGQTKYGMISAILGWLPNLFAGLGITLLGGLILILIGELKIETSIKLRIFIIVIFFIISVIGLIIHEITQKGSVLYYDVNDIWASIAGALLGCIVLLVQNLKLHKQK